MPRYSAWGSSASIWGALAPHEHTSLYNSADMRDSLSAGACPGALFERRAAGRPPRKHRLPPTSTAIQ
eukprot:7159289-Karenia_brevis.AAC.1